MGKNWKGKGGGGGGGGSNDLSNCRGYAAVMATCDAAREKESNKELTNLLSQAIECLYPKAVVSNQQEESSSAVGDSIADLLQQELKQLQNNKHKGAQDVVSINVGTKGIVFAKITRRDVCPVKLVKSIFDQVKTEKVPCSRHLVRLVPLQLVHFGGEEDFVASAKILVEGHFGEAKDKTLPQIALGKALPKRKAEDISGADECPEEEEGGNKRKCVEEEEVPSSSSASGSKERVEGPVGDDTEEPEGAPAPQVATAVPAAPAASSLPEIRYFILFKARNHNVLSKQLVIQKVRDILPPNFKQDYLHGQVGEECLCGYICTALCVCPCLSAKALLARPSTRHLSLGRGALRDDCSIALIYGAIRNSTVAGVPASRYPCLPVALS